jgi:hypothetical protein
MLKTDNGPYTFYYNNNVKTKFRNLIQTFLNYCSVEILSKIEGTDDRKI